MMIGASNIRLAVVLLVVLSHGCTVAVANSAPHTQQEHRRRPPVFDELPEFELSPARHRHLQQQISAAKPAAANPRALTPKLAAAPAARMPVTAAAPAAAPKPVAAGPAAAAAAAAAPLALAQGPATALDKGPATSAEPPTAFQTQEADLRRAVLNDSYDKMSYPWAEYGPANVSLSVVFHRVLDVNLYAGGWVRSWVLTGGWSRSVGC